jgi:hypothetical protein
MPAAAAVDGVANKQADVAWLGVPVAAKAARFVSAEAVRWTEWGMRSYHDFTLGLALLLFTAAVARTAGIPRPVAYLMGLSGLACLVQGWVVGAEGFSGTHSALIVVTWVLSVAWMIWRVVVAWADTGVAAPSRGPMTPGRPDAIPAIRQPGDPATLSPGDAARCRRGRGHVAPVRSRPPVGEVLRQVNPAGY